MMNTHNIQSPTRQSVWLDSLVGFIASLGVGLLAATTFATVVFALVVTTVN